MRDSTTPIATPVLILPGLGNSGPDHWQSHWERLDPACERVLQDEWDAPLCASWVARLGEAVAAASSRVLLVAHSSSCALVAHWAATASQEQRARVRGALLVAPSDPDGPNYPAGPVGFSPVPMRPLPFATIVVASTDDRYVTLERAREYAEAWGSRLVLLESAGHINSESGLGAWPEGYALLNELANGSPGIG